MEQMRDFDFVMFEHDVLTALGGLAADVMSALPTTVLGGLRGAQTSSPSLTINISSGRIYQFAAADATAAGSIPQDLNVIVQQGFNAGQAITLISPSPGQSQWNLIQAQFSQVDAVRTNDPNGGIVPFYNAANPSQPTSNSINTVRKGVCVLQVITGSAATTGSEVPPAPTTGWVPLYLIDLAGGQTQITTGQIIVAGPSVGTGVSSAYASAPFLAGLLASHHGGTPGQAPKIKLGSEVQGILPYANMSPVRTALNANLTLYVATTGSDSNTGLLPTVPFKTLQAAVNSLYHNYDFAGNAATISVANGTYTAGAQVIGLPPGMSVPINIVGNVGSPASCVINVANGNAFSVLLGASLAVSGFSVLAGGVSTNAVVGCGLLAGAATAISFSAMVFGACSNTHLAAFTGSIIQSLGAAYVINGGATSHMFADGGTIQTTSSPVTLVGVPAFSNAFAAATLGGVVLAGGAIYTGTATGAKYACSNLGQISSGGAVLINFFPGNIAGVGTTPGVSPFGLYT